LSISSKTYATPLTIELATPVYPAAIALGAHVLAGVALLFSSLPAALVWATFAILFASAYHVMFRLRYFNRIIWRSDDSWLLWARNGRHVIARLAVESLATTCITLLNFNTVTSGKCFSVVIFPTAVNADALRRLRVRLRLDSAVRE
jgi:hypothetical protein